MTDWTPYASLAIVLLLQGVGAIVWAVRLEGRVNTRFEVVHERKSAMTKRIDSLETDVKDMRLEIRQTIKEGLSEVKSELHMFHQLLDKKADKAH